MEKKENVYEETKATENIVKEKAEIGEKVGLSQEVLTVAGKFKDVNALVRAYESLQSEFTRRSQRLKELEKLAENPKADLMRDTVATAITAATEITVARLTIQDIITTDLGLVILVLDLQKLLKMDFIYVMKQMKS